MGESKIGATHFWVSCKSAWWGKRDATWPSGPMPRRITSKLGYTPPGKRQKAKGKKERGKGERGKAKGERGKGKCERGKGKGERQKGRVERGKGKGGRGEAKGKMGRGKEKGGRGKGKGMWQKQRGEMGKGKGGHFLVRIEGGKAMMTRVEISIDVVDSRSVNFLNEYGDQVRAP